MSDALRIEVSGKAGPGFVAAVATAVGAEGSVRVVPEGFAADRLLMRAASGLAIPADAGTRVWTLFADDSPVAEFALRFPSDGDGDALRVSVPSGSPALEAGLSALAAKGVSTIHNAKVIDRGYVAVEENLKSLGANIERK